MAKLPRAEAERLVEDFLEELAAKGWLLSTCNDPESFRLQPKPKATPRPSPDE